MIMLIHLSSTRRLVVIICCIVATLVFLIGLRHDIVNFRARTATPESSPDHGLLDDTLNATLGFQNIFIIELSSRTDHRDAAALAAAFTGLEVEFVDAVTHVDEKFLPLGAKEAGLKEGEIGAWRSHLNVIERMVEENISSALILEDDADWDIRIKAQMRDFAKASRLLVQPLPNTTDQFLDPSWPQPDAAHQSPLSLDIEADATGEPTSSPYGDLDRWGMLWVGHCGCRFPWAADGNVPLARAVIPNDRTVPARRHINIEFGDTQLLDQYPDYTRVVAQSRVNTCTLGYALSQAGGRRLLYEMGVHKLSGPIDMMYRHICDGVEGRDLMICLSPQPALFNHHRQAGPRSTFSNIGESDDGSWNEAPFSVNIRWGTRVNLQKLTNGQTDYFDPHAVEQ